MSIAKKPINYLNNKDMLREIHLSKNSYCCFSKQEYNKYDLIIDMPDRSLEKSLVQCLKKSNIKKAKENRASRLAQELGKPVSVKELDDTDVVFRVMTWDHIPLSPKQVRKTIKKKSAQDLFEFEDEEENFEDLEDEKTTKEVDDLVHVKVNFPPFQHFKIDDTGTMVCVGKSHWTGGVKTGHFSKDHGRITENLARMFLMLCQKYAMKYNWRGYSYRDEMEASAVLQLTYVGLRFNEAKSANPFAYYTAATTNSFCRVLNAEKRVQNIRDDLLEVNGMDPSFSRQMRDMKFTKEDS